MAGYRFETIWRLRASRSEAWAVLMDGEAWPRWWPSVRRVEQLGPGSTNGLGRRLRYHFSTRLPYTLTFEAELVEVVEPSRMVAVASGELAGTWTCELDQDGMSLVVRHVWAVDTTRRWMNALAPLARPVFSWNHSALMREGGQGFAARLGTTADIDSTPTQRRPLAALTGAGAAVGLGLAFRAVRRRR